MCLAREGNIESYQSLSKLATCPTKNNLEPVNPVKSAGNVFRQWANIVPFLYGGLNIILFTPSIRIEERICYLLHAQRRSHQHNCSTSAHLRFKIQTDLQRPRNANLLTVSPTPFTNATYH